MRVGVTGANGMLGRDLVPVLRDRGHEVLAWAREDYDVCDPSKVTAVVAEARPDLIIHAAAYSQVDKAESEVELAMRVNGDGAKNVAIACRDCRIPILYIGTDYIFDGAKGTPYLPDDSPNPVNVYGHTKLAGERAVIDLLEDYCIVRTSWLYGREGHNFVRTILQLAREKAEIEIVNDQIGSPTWTGTLARALVDLIDVSARGIFHVTDACEGISWYDFAIAIVDTVGVSVCVNPITTGDLSRAARRPPYSVLDLRKTEATLGYSLPAWRQSLKKACLDQNSKTSIQAHCS